MKKKTETNKLNEYIVWFEFENGERIHSTYKRFSEIDVLRDAKKDARANNLRVTSIYKKQPNGIPIKI